MLSSIQATLNECGYKTFVRPFELNIVGVRANSTAPNRFDDSINVFFKNEKGVWIFLSYAATTDPGTYWLRNPLNEQGTAILKEGQYIGSHQIGLHRNKYTALVQKRNVTVMRDYDRNAVLDFLNGKEDTGLFGINIHHAAGTGTTKTVDQYSAGCQVFANVNEFNGFMKLCEHHRQLYGNDFTYTLIDQRAVERNSKKNS
jgi:hypothetical protein